MPNNEYANEPNQSRSEDIIQSILDGTEYDEAARSRIEYLLIELKNAIEGGGGGGGVTSYSPLTEKPKIDNHTLQSGNNTSSDLGLQTKIDADHKLSADVIDDTNSTNKFNVKSDWNAASGAAGEILNKPTLGTASAKNVPVSGDAATGEVVLGSDTRLTDARNAKDVYNWAKQENKPSYGYSEIQNTPTIPDKLSDLTDDTTHRTVTDTEKTTWNGKQNALTFDNAPTSNSDNPVKSGGVYTALSGKQNNLSEEQMAAANSGIDSTKVAQIETNKNNILLTYNQNGKTFNIVDWSLINGEVGSDNNVTYSYADGIVTVTGTKSVADSYMTVINTLILTPNTNYVVSQIQTGSPDMRLKVFGYDTTWRQLADTGSSTTFNSGTYSKFMVRFTLAGSSTGVAVNKTIKPMLIEKSVYDAGFTDYQPYAMSNAELTALTPITLTKRHIPQSADYEIVSDLTISIPAGKKYLIHATATFNNVAPKGVIINKTNTIAVNKNTVFAEINGGETDYGGLTTSAIVPNTGSTAFDICIFAKFKSANASGSDVLISYQDIT